MPLIGVPCTGTTSQDGREATIMVHASAAASSNDSQGCEQYSKAPHLTYSESLQCCHIYCDMTGRVLACD